MACFVTAARFLLLLAAGTIAVRAEENAIQPLDLSKKEQRLSSRRWSGADSMFSSSLWPGAKTISFGSWHGKYSSLGHKLAPIDVSEESEKKLFPVDGPKQMPIKGAVRSRYSTDGSSANFRNFSKVGPAQIYGGDERIQKQVPNEVIVSREDFVTGNKTPALEDINRYNFRKNGASETGAVPVTRAAGGDSGDQSQEQRSR